MSKAVFVMDMPEDCLHCRFAGMDGAIPHCVASGSHIYFKELKKKPDFCPLKPLPERASKDRVKIYTVPLNPDENDGTREGAWCVGGGRNDDFDTGWNACLEVIGGDDSAAD